MRLIGIVAARPLVSGILDTSAAEHLVNDASCACVECALLRLRAPAYSRGRSDRESGKASSDVPYTDTVAAEEWLRGWKAVDGVLSRAFARGRHARSRGKGSHEVPYKERSTSDEWVRGWWHEHRLIATGEPSLILKGDRA